MGGFLPIYFEDMLPTKDDFTIEFVFIDPMNPMPAVKKTPPSTLTITEIE
jgi:hypothetical protein